MATDFSGSLLSELLSLFIFSIFFPTFSRVERFAGQSTPTSTETMFQ